MAQIQPRVLVAPIVPKQDLVAGVVVAYDAVAQRPVLLVGAADQVLVRDDAEDTGLKFVAKNSLLDFETLTKLDIGDPARAMDSDKIAIWDGAAAEYKYIDRENVTGGTIIFPGASLSSEQAALKIDTDNDLGSADDEYLLHVLHNGGDALQLCTNNNLWLGSNGGFYADNSAKSIMGTHGSYFRRIWSEEITTARHGVGFDCTIRPTITSGSGAQGIGVQGTATWDDSGGYIGTVNSITAGQFAATMFRDHSSAVLSSMFGLDVALNLTSNLTNNPAIGQLYGINVETNFPGQNYSLSSCRGIRIQTPTALGAGTTLANFYGIEIRDIAARASGLNHAIRIATQSGGAAAGNLNFDGANWNTGHIVMEASHWWWDTTNNIYRFKNGAPTSETDGAQVVGDTTTQTLTNKTITATTNKSRHTKTFVIPLPASLDQTLFYVDRAVTIQQVRAVVIGTTPSLTVAVKHDTDRSAAGTDVVASVAVSNTTTGADQTIADATVPADSWIWIESGAPSGAVLEIAVFVEYTDD